jgi:hypothetical protein
MPYKDVKAAHGDFSDEGGMYGVMLTPARETERWLKAQDQFSEMLDDAVKKGVVTEANARKAKAWARRAQSDDIEDRRDKLEQAMRDPALPSWAHDTSPKQASPRRDLSLPSWAH